MTLYCRCAFAQVIPEDVKNRHLAELCEGDEAFDAVPDLCEMAAKCDPKLKEIAGNGTSKIVACHPRAVQGLFRQVGSPLPEEVEIVNMRENPED